MALFYATQAAERVKEASIFDLLVQEEWEWAKLNCWFVSGIDQMHILIDHNSISFRRKRLPLWPLLSQSQKTRLVPDVWRPCGFGGASGRKASKEDRFVSEDPSSLASELHPGEAYGKSCLLLLGSALNSWKIDGNTRREFSASVCSCSALHSLRAENALEYT